MSQGIAPLSAEEEAWYQAEIEGIYDTFVGVVSEGRGMSTEAVDEIAQGRVWSGSDALEIGLCDEKGTIIDAIDFAAEKAGLDKYRIVCYPESKSLRETIMDAGKDDDDDSPLVRSLRSLQPGLNTMALMPFITVGTIKPEF